MNTFPYLVMVQTGILLEYNKQKEENNMIEKIPDKLDYVDQNEQSHKMVEDLRGYESFEDKMKKKKTNNNNTKNKQSKWKSKGY